MIESTLGKIAWSNWAAPAAIAFVHLMLGLLVFHQGPAAGGDDATYISLARSLMSRHDYTNIGDAAMQPHTAYPPVFPLIVAGGLASGLDTVVGLRLLMIVLSATAVFASCLWLKRAASPAVALSAGFFIAISPEIVRISQGVLSDTTFWCLSIVALLAWRRADAARPDRGGARVAMPIGWVLIAAVATLLAYFTRSAGAPLLVASIIWLALSRQPRAIGILAAMSVPLIFAWWLRGSAAGAEGYAAPFLSIDPYAPSLGNVTPFDMIKRVAGNVASYTSRQLPRLVFGTPLAGALFGAAFASAVMFGWARRVRKAALPEIWFALYLGVVLLWPVTWAGARFLIPIAPLMALYVAESIARVIGRGTYPRLYGTIAIVAGAFLVRPALAQQISFAAACREEFARGNQFPCTDAAFGDFVRVAALSRGKLPDASVVLARKPSIFFHYSGYRSRPYPMFAEPDSLFSLAARLGAEYVVVDRISGLSSRYLVPTLLARRGDFCAVDGMSTANATLMRFELSYRPPPISSPNAFAVCDSDRTVEL